jgi:hypothetical protein
VNAVALDVVRWKENVSRAAVWSGGVCRLGTDGNCNIQAKSINLTRLELSETHSKRGLAVLILERPEAPIEPVNGTRFQVEVE